MCTTHIVMEPLNLMARLAALIPPPRMHLAHLEKAAGDESRPELAPQAARAPPAQPRLL